MDKIVSANAEHKSTGKAQKMLFKLAEISVSVPLISEYTAEIGAELNADLPGVWVNSRADRFRVIIPVLLRSCTIGDFVSRICSVR